MLSRARYMITPFTRTASEFTIPPALAQHHRDADGKVSKGQIEMKYLDEGQAQVPIQESWDDALISIPGRGMLGYVPFGTGPSHRLGRQVTLQSIQVRGFVAYGALTDEGDPNTPALGREPSVRLLLVLATATNGSQVLPSNLFATADTDPTLRVYSYADPSQMKNYVILADEIMVLNPDTPSPREVKVTTTGTGAGTGTGSENTSNAPGFLPVYESTGVADPAVDVVTKQTTALSLVSTSSSVSTETYAEESTPENKFSRSGAGHLFTWSVDLGGLIQNYKNKGAGEPEDIGLVKDYSLHIFAITTDSYLSLTYWSRLTYFDQ